MISKKWLRVFCGLSCFCGLIVLMFTFLPGPAGVPSFEEVRAAHSRSESVLLDRHGEIIHEQRTDSSARRLDWVPLPAVSPALASALLYAEDRRFYQHHGVDWASLAGALAAVLRSGARGASTITMQLAAQLDEELRPSDQRRSLRQKWQQILSARALERRWSKAQILEAYLNTVTFRGELQGLAAAAAGLFGKQAHGLTDVESVILAALVRSPNADIDQVARRAGSLAGALKLDLKPAEISTRAGEALGHPYLIRPQAALAPHVAQRLFREARIRGGHEPGRIVCTLDRGLQQFAAEALRRHLLAEHVQNVRDGAVLVLDNRTGEVLAYVGNTGSQGSARYVDGIQALRQAGSTLKPFIYGAAFDRRVLTAASLLDDSPLDVPVAGGMYRPSNYDRLFHGPVTARTALASSLNVPAVRTLNLIGVEAALSVLRVAGFDKLQSDDFYGSSLALGAADVSLWELVDAYRSLANGGIWSPPRLTLDETTGPARQVLTPEATFIVSNILSDRESRSQTFSLESPLSTRYWTAVKTGTSKDMRDNWCVGFSDRYTVGVWAGNFSGEPMWNVSGITGAAPVWVEIMNRLHRDQSSSAPQPPPGVVAREAPAGNGHREWFIRGTEMAVAPGAANPGIRIAYPSPGTVVALDPDIPPEKQKLFFEAQPRDDRLHWVLDGQVLGGAGTLLLWAPTRGKHALALVDLSDRTLDSVTFEVRGYRDESWRNVYLPSSTTVLRPFAR
ncbi:MAG: penicillin-binding protein 1C [Acidobacteriia bacterium]|nr:penicillin-binding protein 1C [Terriglobia bacterium]